MHDMMREVCLSKAKEENFLQVVNKATTPTSDPRRTRRLAAHFNKAYEIFGRKSNKKVRSVLFYGNKFNRAILSNHPGFRSLPLLRVLDLSWVYFEGGGGLPSSIGELIHLRFLSLEEASVTHLPSSVRNLKLLLYLNLNVDAKAVQVPNVLKEMLQLRYLYLPPSMDYKIKLELGDLVNLESLANFSTKHNNVTDLCRMIKLRDLKVEVEGGCTNETLSSSLIELRDLETLSITNYSRDHKGEVVLDLIHLKELNLGIRMPRLPAQQRLPPHLAKIYLWSCMMKEDPMPILEKLLHLKSVVLLSDAFVGRRMMCSKGGFPQLCFLHIIFHGELEEWIVEEGSMPCLQTLEISGCKKLKKLPDGLKYIASLKILRIARMKREFKEKLEACGEDYYKIQHIPTVQFISCEED